MIKKHLFAILYGMLLTAFTVYVAMDTFVITRVYSDVPVEESASVPEESASVPEESAGTDNAEDSESRISRRSRGKNPKAGKSSTTTEKDSDSEQSGADQSSISTETAYEDENVTITITEYREYDTSIYVADIRLSSPDYLKTALAQNVYGKNVTEKTSAIALANNAILAINGDYYGSQEKGYVLRNGVLYRDSAEKGQEDLVIYVDGSFEIIVEDEITAQELLEKGAVQILSFGPALVTGGEVSVTADEEVGKSKSSNPRTAIGIIDDLHYLFVVSDGRTSESEGLSLYQLSEFMAELGAGTAYNLDGGGSSSMVFNGTVINNPTTTGNTIKERSVSDIVYIG